MAMNRTTGKEITGRDEVEQAIDTILEHNPGDRVMRYPYGSGLMELTDMPMNPSGRAKLAQSVGEALRTYEPRVRVSRVAYEGEPGSMTATVYGVVKTTGDQILVRRG